MRVGIPEHLVERRLVRCYLSTARADGFSPATWAAGIGLPSLPGLVVPATFGHSVGPSSTVPVPPSGVGSPGRLFPRKARPGRSQFETQRIVLVTCLTSGSSGGFHL